MRKILLFIAAMLVPMVAQADDNVYFKKGPLELTIPLKTARVTYLYDFHAKQNLVGGESPIIGLWNDKKTEAYDPRVEGTVGAVTSLDGQGTPFVGGNILIGNVLDKYVSLPSDFAIGGFGGWNFNSDAPIYGLKASLKIW